MNAAGELVAIGTELLRYGREDTNSLWVAERLRRLGILVGARTAVEDDEERIAQVLRGARERARLVVAYGGLGPTDDDRTREALARALDSPLEEDPEMLARLREVFRSRGWRASPERGRLAVRPRGCTWIPNPVGGAPGLRWERDGTRLYVLPGVPAEMHAMMEATVLPELERSGLGVSGLASTVLKIAGMRESAVDDVLRDLYQAADVEITVLARATGVEVVLLAEGADTAAARRRLEAVASEVRRRLGHHVFGADDDTLPAVVGRLLQARGATVAVAESCTGGRLSGEITEVPGASGWFQGGLVAYQNVLKVRWVGVSEAAIREHGAVSEPVARELARGARRVASADFGIGVTGIAGPGGGAPHKPVGLVHIAVAGEDGERHRAFQFAGDRTLIRMRAATAALEMLRRMLLKLP